MIILKTKLKIATIFFFTLVKLSRKRAKDKKWFTPGLKRCSRHKNILYRKWRQSGLTKDEKKYKVYRKYYRKILIGDELFDTKTNSVKQLWKKLATVASLGKHKSKCIINKVIYENENTSDTKKDS